MPRRQRQKQRRLPDERLRGINPADLVDFDMPRETRAEANQLYRQAHEAYDAYVEDLGAERERGGKVGPRLEFGPWLDGQIATEHGEWATVLGMARPYIVLDPDDYPSQATARQAALRLGRPVQATKAAGRSLLRAISPSRVGRRAAASAASRDPAVCDLTGPVECIDLTEDDLIGNFADWATPSPPPSDPPGPSVGVVDMAGGGGAAASSGASSSCAAAGGGGVSGAVPGAAPARDRSLIVYLPRNPAASGARASATPSAGGPASSARLYPFHRFCVTGPRQPWMGVATLPWFDSSKEGDGVCSAFDPAGVHKTCPLRFGPSLTLLPWQCSHRDCPTRLAGEDPPVDAPHYWCEHHYDLCVPCAQKFALHGPYPLFSAQSIPLIDHVDVVFDSSGRETVTVEEGESTTAQAGPLHATRRPTLHVPASICRIYHAAPVSLRCLLSWRFVSGVSWPVCPCLTSARVSAALSRSCSNLACCL